MDGFTAGPWEASKGAIWAISPWNARVCIASATTFSPMNAIDTEANARLIAAAPELLAFAEWINRRSIDGSPESIKAREVIAKATGADQ